ncbi:MAG TPA: hypothetical protein VL093_13785 [Flavipsychrobacter sp.]|nr:hypothetical protein [Flavipsychrobacter sp.]
MNLRILMMGDDLSFMQADATLLRENGFRVHVCDNLSLINELVEEVKPDIAFINPQLPTSSTTDVYHNLLDNIVYACLPVIYTLSEDDVYLVNRKRTELKERRYIISDNILEAINMALAPAKSSGKTVPLQSNNYNIAKSA